MGVGFTKERGRAEQSGRVYAVISQDHHGSLRVIG